MTSAPDQHVELDSRSTATECTLAALPFSQAEDSEVTDLWWTRWSLLAPYWQGYKRSLLQANFLKGYLLRGLRTVPRDTPHIPGSMERFVNLPTELKFEIFRHLHAIDMYHMSLACSAFQEVLSHPASFPLWRRAFARMNQFPPCPTALTEPQWAALMFGPARCEDCGRFGAQPDIALYKNFCSPCTDNHFLSKEDILEMFKSHSDPKLVYTKLKTVCQSHCRLVTLQLRTRPSEGRREKKFMREHVEQYAPLILKEIQQSEDKDSDLPVSINSENPGRWRLRRMEQIATTNEHTMVTLRWVVKILTELQEEHRKRMRACIVRCQKRITNLNLGYTYEDIFLSAEGEWRIYFQALGIQRMTRKEFRNHSTFLISVVRKRASSRLKVARILEIKAICADFRTRLRPHEWLHYPPLNDLVKAPCFREYIDQDIDYRTRFSVRLAREKLPGVLQDWIQVQRDTLEKLCIQEGKSFPADSPNIDLAKCVFVCSQCKRLDKTWEEGEALCGWKNACTHMCHVSSSKHINLKFSPRGEAFVISMLKTMGFDPDTTTAQEMDDLDLRFFCANCRISGHRKSVTGKPAYTWMESITHGLQEIGEDHRDFSFDLLSAELTRFVKDHEALSHRPSVGAGAWGCAHCSLHLDEAVQLRPAIKHVKESHGISEPVLHKDVVRFDNRYQAAAFRPRRPFVCKLRPVLNMMCKRCPPLPICKLWEHASLKKHLRSEHDILDPVDQEDWVTVDTLRHRTLP